MNILTNFTASCLFTFVREGTMCVEFNSVILFTILYSRFKHCAKDVCKVTAQRTILEYGICVDGLHGSQEWVSISGSNLMEI